ncbi:MAG: hypothetical protein ACI9MC_000153 [Kiritimatiellia bacterium]|jgi:hypothetical protein
MVERVCMEVELGRMGLCVSRYELLCRMSNACRKRRVALLAFGVGSGQLRMVLDGSDEGIRGVVKALKIGTRMFAHRWNHTVTLGSTSRWRVGDVCAAVVWAHRASLDGGDPLGSIWTSHRDLMCFRSAPFYDASVLLDRGVVPLDVHRALGGGQLPDGWPPETGIASLNTVLRVCAAVMGVLPSDRACFRLFSHVAKACGHTSKRTAAALTLTSRRVRQLRGQEEPLVGTVLVCLADARLSVVP